MNIQLVVRIKLRKKKVIEKKKEENKRTCKSLDAYVAQDKSRKYLLHTKPTTLKSSGLSVFFFTPMIVTMISLPVLSNEAKY